METKKWEWERMPDVQLFNIASARWIREAKANYMHEDENYIYFVYFRDLLNTRQGNMRHLIIHKTNKDELKKDFFGEWFKAVEPSYEERVEIMRGVGKWKKVALEVYPAEKNLIDEANIYHLWEVEDKRFLPFSVDKALECPELNKSIKLGKLSIRYSERRNVDGFNYLYVQRADGKELKWREKQFIKNEMYFEDVTAVEVIMEKGMNKNYSVLICLPYDFQLDFGIHKDF